LGSVSIIFIFFFFVFVFFFSSFIFIIIIKGFASHLVVVDPEGVDGGYDGEDLRAGENVAVEDEIPELPEALEVGNMSFASRHTKPSIVSPRPTSTRAESPTTRPSGGAG